MSHSNAVITPGQMAIEISAIIVILLLAAICSGLNIGLLGIDPLRLETIEKKGTNSEQKAAKRVKRLMEDRHLLLCAILLFNALCMEVLPLLLDHLVGPSLAILLAITGLLLFGEIVPQAICNKYGLQVGGFVAPILWAMIFSTFVITYPLARLLDCIVGSPHARFFQRRELEQLIMMHSEDAIDQLKEETQPESKRMKTNDGESESSTSDEHLNPEEARQIQGAIRAAGLTIKEATINISKVVMLPVDTIFDMQTINNIVEKGYSRIPIFEGSAQNIIGVIHVKQLMLYKPEKKQQLNRQAVRQNLLFFDPTTRIFDALNQFQTGKSHLAIVRDEATVYGIVTLEDLVEIILQTQIMDEDDKKEQARLEEKQLNKLALSTKVDQSVGLKKQQIEKK